MLAACPPDNFQVGHTVGFVVAVTWDPQSLLSLWPGACTHGAAGATSPSCPGDYRPAPHSYDFGFLTLTCKWTLQMRPLPSATSSQSSSVVAPPDPHPLGPPVGSSCVDRSHVLASVTSAATGLGYTRVSGQRFRSPWRHTRRQIARPRGSSAFSFLRNPHAASLVAVPPLCSLPLGTGGRGVTPRRCPRWPIPGPLSPVIAPSGQCRSPALPSACLMVIGALLGPKLVHSLAAGEDTGQALRAASPAFWKAPVQPAAWQAQQLLRGGRALRVCSTKSWCQPSMAPAACPGRAWPLAPQTCLGHTCSWSWGCHPLGSPAAQPPPPAPLCG